MRSGRWHAYTDASTPEQAERWLPKVHLIVANLECFVLGTFHGASGQHLQEYIDEFAYRFSRRHWEGQRPQRLFETAVTHLPIPTRAALS